MINCACSASLKGDPPSWIVYSMLVNSSNLPSMRTKKVGTLQLLYLCKYLLCVSNVNSATILKFYFSFSEVKDYTKVEIYLYLQSLGQFQAVSFLFSNARCQKLLTSRRRAFFWKYFCRSFRLLVLLRFSCCVKFKNNRS